MLGLLQSLLEIIIARSNGGEVMHKAGKLQNSNTENWAAKMAVTEREKEAMAEEEK